MDILSIYVKMIGDKEPKSRRVQIRSRSDNSIRWESREFPGDIRQHIDRIGNDHQNRFRRVAGERGNDISEKSDVPLEQVGPRLAGVLARTGGDDAEIGSGSDGVIHRSVNLRAGEEGSGVLEIEHLAAEFIGLGVDEDELVCKVLGEDSLGNCHADIAGADDGDLSVPFGRGRRGGTADGFEESL